MKIIKAVSTLTGFSSIYNSGMIRYSSKLVKDTDSSVNLSASLVNAKCQDRMTIRSLPLEICCITTFQQGTKLKVLT